MVTIGTNVLVTSTAAGTYLVHEAGQRPVEGVAVHHYERNSAWVCEIHGANHANTHLDCQHIELAMKRRRDDDSG